MLDLRPVQAGDAPAVHQLLSDPEVAQWLRPAGVTGPFTLEECEFMHAGLPHVLYRITREHPDA